jgi:hypothetical protein
MTHPQYTPPADTSGPFDSLDLDIEHTETIAELVNAGAHPFGSLGGFTTRTGIRVVYDRETGQILGYRENSEDELIDHPAP